MNVNKTLLLSLEQEIHILNKLIEDVSKGNGDQRINSWLVPSQSYDFITKTVSSKKFKAASYQNCLEITLDRLYVVIRFLIIYINNCDSVKNAKENKLIVPPSRLSLGYCVRSLWTRIVKIMEKKAIHKTTISSDNEEFCDKKIQTDIISLNKCDSCSSAMLCMKNLVNFFEDPNKSNERLKIKYKLYDITQFGSMLQVTSSIEDSLNTLFEQLHEKKKENNLLKLENENFKSVLHGKDCKIAFFEEEIDILRGKLTNDKQEILTLKQHMGKLTEENNLMENKMKYLQKMTVNLHANVQSLNKKNDILEQQNNSLINKMGTTTKLLSEYVLKLNKKTSILDAEYDLVKRIIDQYEKSINCLNIKLSKLTKHLDKIELKIKYRYDSMEEILKDLLKHDEFCVKIKEMFTEKLQSIKEINEKSSVANKLKGNPLEDFPKQIEENKNKIKDLENENIKLEQLLVRLKNIKTGYI